MNLKKCPFCGGDAEIWHEMHPPFGEYVYCKKCGCRTLKHIDAQNAIIEWNRRFDPPNDPLTLEQLREIDGEPVWIKSIIGAYITDGWALVCKSWSLCKKSDGSAAFFDRCGKWWLAYRRRPEDGTT